MYSNLRGGLLYMPPIDTSNGQNSCRTTKVICKHYCAAYYCVGLNIPSVVTGRKVYFLPFPIYMWSVQRRVEHFEIHSVQDTACQCVDTGKCALRTI